MLDFLFGGGGDVGPSAEEYEQMRADYWKTYSGWVGDERRDYAKRVGTTAARLAAGGVSRKSEGWKQVMNQLEAEHQKTIEGFKKTETYGQLEELRGKGRGPGGFRHARHAARRTKGYELDPETGEYVLEDTMSDRFDRISAAEYESRLKQAEEAKKEAAMSTEEWYAARYDTEKEKPADTPSKSTSPTAEFFKKKFQPELTSKVQGKTGPSSAVSFMGELAKSPFASFG